jgi:hypothetical protein
MADPNSVLGFYLSGDSVDVDFPQYGYTTDIVMSIANLKRRDNSYSFFDRTNTYDSRKCSMVFNLEETESESFVSYWSDPDIRASTSIMNLGTQSGFFPFGADKGDSNLFNVDLIAHEYKYNPRTTLYEHKLDLSMVSAPSYSPPSEIDQGELSIGSISGLLMCQEQYDVLQNWNYIKSMTNGGVLKTIDGPGISDGYESRFNQLCNQSKAAALIAYLITNRSGDISVTATNARMFGHQSSDSYTVNLIGTGSENIVIRATHSDYDNFDIELNFFLKSVS